jgi:hypothetical protein
MLRHIPQDSGNVLKQIGFLFCDPYKNAIKFLSSLIQNYLEQRYK